MSQQKSHVMDYVRTDASGADEWYCPICGRRFLMQWPPDYKRIILESGDENVRHSGGKGGVTMGSFDVTQNGQASGASSAEPADEHLVPWLQWMDKVDFDSLWNTPD
jgi:hypothetical protein